MSHDNKHGFTLVELMLAMSFIAVLMVAIAVTTMQIGAIYNKGITLREVNQAGRAISDELQRSIASSVPFDVTPKVDDSPATATSRYVVRDTGGRLCIGRYTYVWSYGQAITSGTAVNRYNNDGSAVRFAKVSDPSGSLCTDPTLAINRADASEMLTIGDRDLVVHKFNVTSVARDTTTGQAIYAISMTLGTNDNEQLTTNFGSCKPPAEGRGKEDFCSVNQFDIIVRAGNQSGGDK